MSDEEENVEEKPFAIEIAKQGRAVCKKCKQKCLRGDLRIAKIVANPFGGGKMKAWHHINCLFEQFLKQRVATKRIDGPDDIEGWEMLGEDEKNEILERIENCENAFIAKFGAKATTKPDKKQKTSPKVNVAKVEKVSLNAKKIDDEEASGSTSSNATRSDNTSKDHLFKEFRKLVADVTNVPSYIDKTNCVKKVFNKGSDCSGFKGDVVLWCRLLLPGVVKRVYNLQSKQLIKLFSKIFHTDQDDMLEHLEQGDIGETIQKYFEESLTTKPAKKSTLKVKEVDDFLIELSKLTKEDDQMSHFENFVCKCTSNDLKMVIRLIKGDLRMGAGAKHILEGVHPDAYGAYQASRNIETVINRCLGGEKEGKSKNNTVKAEISVMTPILPMLAEACKSVEQAMKKCPNGMYSEIKYDGERVQVHKHGSDFKYFSRSLKPVLAHKIRHFAEYIPKAFPHAKDLILDSEILMIDTNTSKPLPFGTLGKHKKNEFTDANVCLFVFDCIYYNGESLINKPISYRRNVLQENMIEIPNRIVFSEMQEIHKQHELAKMIATVLKLGLEGLVLKDLNSTYEPGKRHWLKVKKDYLFDGAMADSADLIVLGAWYGTGKKGGMMSVFLMGCYNPKTKKFCTVTKVHTGHDDKTLDKLQRELDMVKISQDMSKVPAWLNCTKTMLPDFVAKDPKKQPVWEITGAEFTQHDVHTADGISIRFPRVTRIRDDKHWDTATNLQELQNLYKSSKENTDVSLLMKGINSEEDKNQTNDDSPTKKRKKKSTGSEQTSKKQKTLFADMEKDVDASDEKQENKSDSSIASTSVSSESKQNNGVELKNPIPNYFKGVKALLEDELKEEEHAELRRYFIAYGGLILKDNQREEATHVFHSYTVIREPTIKCPLNAKHLAMEWVKDSIANDALQDFRCYTIKWDPDV